MEEIDRLRTEFNIRDVPHMYIAIEASGRPTGEIKIKFRIDGDYKCQSVEGNSVDATMDEFFRRNEWKQPYDVLMLPAVEGILIPLPRDKSRPTTTRNRRAVLTQGDHTMANLTKTVDPDRATQISSRRSWVTLSVLTTRCRLMGDDPTPTTPTSDGSGATTSRNRAQAPPGHIGVDRPPPEDDRSLLELTKP